MIKPIVLCILDGWGHRNDGGDNAIYAAATPTWDRLLNEWPHTLLQASEQYVGLPKGQMGNSEVGHMNIGAGRVIPQNLPRIDASIKDATLGKKPALEALINNLKRSGGSCHLLGLLSPGGVHSHQNQIIALAKLLTQANIPVKFHGFLDGRDTPPQSAQDYINSFQQDCPNATFASLGGRYFGMDRDKRWERIQQAYDAIVTGEGDHSVSPDQMIQGAYKKGVTDEFIPPTVIGDYQGMKDGDGVLMCNFRADRVRQILGALLDPQFKEFKRKQTIQFAAQVGMVEYSTALIPLLDTLFAPIQPQEVLGEIVAAAGLKQLRIAETEKYAHVTFFFNGGREKPFHGEDRLLVPSPKVATYDLKPEMSAFEVTEKLQQALEEKSYDLVVLNYANTDMVGHTGDQAAAQKAVQTIDSCLAKLEKAVLSSGGALLITADHGNVEVMRNPNTGNPHTAHTCNPVPFVLCHPELKGAQLTQGCLADVAPTILTLMNINVPAAMTGQPLIVNKPLTSLK